MFLKIITSVSQNEKLQVFMLRQSKIFCRLYNRTEEIKSTPLSLQQRKDMQMRVDVVILNNVCGVYLVRALNMIS